MRTTLYVSLATAVLLSVATSSARANGSIRILKDCRANSEVQDAFAGAGCHQLTKGGASFALVSPGTQAVLFSTKDCSGPTRRTVDSEEFNFCANKYEDGKGINDNVRSVRLLDEPSIRILKDCRANAEVQDTFAGAGCHQLTKGGASFALVSPGTQAVLFSTKDCSGPTKRTVDSEEFNFCANKYEDGKGINDNVRSVRIGAQKTCPVNKSFSQADYCLEGGKGKPDCCVCPPGTKWSNVSANYRQCIPE